MRKFPYLDLVIGVTGWNEMPNKLWKYIGKTSYNTKCHEFEVDNKDFYKAIVVGIYIHDKTLEILTPTETIKKYSEYAKLYERNKEVYISEYYQDNGIVQVDLLYARRCIEAYGLNADEILKNEYWHFIKE